MGESYKKALGLKQNLLQDVVMNFMTGNKDGILMNYFQVDDSNNLELDLVKELLLREYPIEKDTTYVPIFIYSNNGEDVDLETYKNISFYVPEIVNGIPNNLVSIKKDEELARKEAEEKARKEAEEKARKEAEEKARKEAE